MAIGLDTPRVETAREYLATLGVSERYLNRYLRKNEVPKERGRFPRIFEIDDGLVDVIFQTFNRLYDPSIKVLVQRHERREVVASEIVKYLKRQQKSQ